MVLIFNRYCFVYKDCNFLLHAIDNCNMNALFSFDLFIMYISACEQQLMTMK